MARLIVGLAGMAVLAAVLLVSRAKRQGKKKRAAETARQAELKEAILRGLRVAVSVHDRNGQPSELESCLESECSFYGAKVLPLEVRLKAAMWEGDPKAFRSLSRYWDALLIRATADTYHTDGGMQLLVGWRIMTGNGLVLDERTCSYPWKDPYLSRDSAASDVILQIAEFLSQESVRLGRNRHGLHVATASDAVPA